MHMRIWFCKRAHASFTHPRKRFLSLSPHVRHEESPPRPPEVGRTLNVCPLICHILTSLRSGWLNVLCVPTRGRLASCRNVSSHASRNLFATSILSSAIWYARLMSSSVTIGCRIIRMALYLFPFGEFSMKCRANVSPIPLRQRGRFSTVQPFKQ